MIPAPEELHSIACIERGVGWGAEPNGELIKEKLSAATVEELRQALSQADDSAKMLSAAVMAPAWAERDPQQRGVLIEELLPLLASGQVYHIELCEGDYRSTEDVKLWQAALKSVLRTICGIPAADRLPDYLRTFSYALRNAEPYAVRQLVDEAPAMAAYGERVKAIEGAARALRDGLEEGGLVRANALDGIAWLKESWRTFPEESAAIDRAVGA